MIGWPPRSFVGHVDAGDRGEGRHQVEAAQDVVVLAVPARSCPATRRSRGPGCRPRGRSPSCRGTACSRSRDRRPARRRCRRVDDQRVLARCRARGPCPSPARSGRPARPPNRVLALGRPTCRRNRGAGRLGWCFLAKQTSMKNGSSPLAACVELVERLLLVFCVDERDAPRQFELSRTLPSSSPCRPRPYQTGPP